MPGKSYLNLPCIQMIFWLFIIKIGIVLGVHSLCTPWWRPKTWFTRIIKWGRTCFAAPFDDHPFNSLFVVLSNHDSSFCFIVEEPEFGGCLCLILLLLCHRELILLAFVLATVRGQAANQIEAWSGSDHAFISLTTPLTGIIILIPTLAEATWQRFSYI